MKNVARKRSSRPHSDLPEPIQQRLNSYALAATAAGAGMLALAQPAQARIVHTAIHKVIRPNHTYGIDLNHDGHADFAIKNRRSCDVDNTCTSLVSAIHYAANGVEGTAGTRFTPPQAYALKAGKRIGGKRPFLGVRMAGAGQTTVGNWYNVRNHYLGLSFQIKGKTHYGWARLTVELGAGFTVTLTGFAYETIPNKPIIAGKTQSADNDITTDRAALAAPGSHRTTLGALALGSPGLPIWRRRETSLAF